MASSSSYDPSYTPKTPRQIDDLVEQSDAATQDKITSTEIERVINDKLGDLNNHDYDAIDRHRTEIEDKLCDTYDDVEVIRYGGSHLRRTDVYGISDVDILVPMGQAADTPVSSNQALYRLADVLRERYPNSKIEVGRMAVTIRFSDGIEVQLLPAFKTGADRFRIPDPNSSGWVETRPTAFAKKLTEANRQHGGYIVPAIKVAKYLCHKYDIAVSSYHLENMIVESLSGYSGKLNQHDMLQHIFNQAKSQCLRPMSDPCGQSSDVAGSISPQERAALAVGFRALEQKIADANAARASDKWKTLLE